MIERLSDPSWVWRHIDEWGDEWCEMTVIEGHEDVAVLKAGAINSIAGYKALRLELKKMGFTRAKAERHGKTKYYKVD